MPLVDTLTVTVQDPRRAKLEGGKPLRAGLRVPARRRPADRHRRARRRASRPASATRCCSAPPAPARPSPPPRSSRRPSARRSSSPPTRRWRRSSTASSSPSFRENAVEYFVSYYDYYQPEAYVPRTDTYIEKESQINEQIDRMRHSATRALLERDDVIIVASVSCIYGIGSAETYGAMTQDLVAGQRYDQRQVIARPRRAAVPPQRRRLPARHLPRARRFARDSGRRTSRTAPGGSPSSATSSKRSTSSTP